MLIYFEYRWPTFCNFLVDGYGRLKYDIPNNGNEKIIRSWKCTCIPPTYFSTSYVLSSCVTTCWSDHFVFSLLFQSELNINLRILTYLESLSDHHRSPCLLSVGYAWLSSRFEATVWSESIIHFCCRVRCLLWLVHFSRSVCRRRRRSSCAKCHNCCRRRRCKT